MARTTDGDADDAGGCPRIRQFRPPRLLGIQLLLGAAFSSPAAAQLPEFPTLAGAGAEYISSSGLFQLSLSGQLDLEGMHIAHSWEAPPANTNCETCHVAVARGLREGEGALRTYRLRIFADVFLGDHLYSLIEFRSDRGSDAVDGGMRGRVEQAYVRVVSGSGVTGLQVGRFATPFGAYPMWHLTSVDYFLRPPLGYEYRTVMNRWRVPMDAQDFLGWKEAPEALDRPGAPPVWEVPYQWGALVFGRLGPVDLRAAVMNSAPASGPPTWKLKRGRFGPPSWVVGARMKPWASLDIGVSYNRGPWMEEIIDGTIQPPPGSPPGTEAPGSRDFDQELFSADIGFARGQTMVRVEAILDRWEVPNVVGTPTDFTISLEVQRDLAAGLFVAVRGGLIDFRTVDDGLGAASPLPDGTAEWDHDVYRYEASLGYRLARNVGLLFSVYQQVQAEVGDGDARLVGLRLWWAF